MDQDEVVPELRLHRTLRTHRHPSSVCATCAKERSASMRLTWPCNRSAGGAALELSFHTLQSWEGTSFSDGKAADELVLSRSQLAAKVTHEPPCYE